tara:strand:+ start:285 stop:857 length:573 start_codon:yes stop_codon:yes gene_type:complete
MRIPICFLDMVLILLVCMILLYNPITKKKEEPAPPPTAEFILNVSWPAENDADIDTWGFRADNPASITGFTRRENDVFILHNDNTSRQYGAVEGIELTQARETMTIETIKDGEYMFSLHGYRVPPDVERVLVTVEFQKSRPFKHIFRKTVEVVHDEEVPICSFYIDEDGHVRDLQLKQSLLEGFIGDTLE